MLFPSPRTFRECSLVPVQVIKRLRSRAVPSVDPQETPLVASSQVKVVTAGHNPLSLACQMVFLPLSLSSYPDHTSALWFVGWCGRLSMAFDMKSRCPTSSALPSAMEPVFSSRRRVRLVRHDLPLVYPFWLVSVTFLSFPYLEMVSSICFLTFLGRGQGSWLIARVTVLHDRTYGWGLDLTYYQDQHMDGCSCFCMSALFSLSWRSLCYWIVSDLWCWYLPLMVLCTEVVCELQSRIKSWMGFVHSHFIHFPLEDKHSADNLLLFLWLLKCVVWTPDLTAAKSSLLAIDQ